MRKIVSDLLKLFLIILTVATYVLNPYLVHAAPKSTTLAGLRQELKDAKYRKQQLDNKKQLTKNEINKNNNAIADSYTKIEESEQKITQAKIDISSNQIKINELKVHIENLMRSLQIMNGENALLQFVSDSSSMTELVMRNDAINAITSYNQEKILEAENMIKELEARQVELKKYEEELNNNIINYQAKVKELNSSLNAISDVAMDINAEIKMIQDLVNFYEDLGCKENENLDSCLNSLNNTRWLKPFHSARVSSNYGWRTLNGEYAFHSGIDLAVKEGTPVLSVAAGTVISVQPKTPCGGNVVYAQYMVAGERYTVNYAHLLTINVKSGQKLTNQTVIGTSGGSSTRSYDRCTFGAHLHTSYSKGYYTGWSKFQANLFQPPGFPKAGSWFYSRAQWF